MLIRVKNFFLDILFPAYCVACHTEGSFLCRPCANTLPLLPPACIGCGIMTPESILNSDNSKAGYMQFAGHTCDRCRKKTPICVFLSPFPYKHPTIRRIIHEFKYRRITLLSPIMADLVISYLRYYRIPLSEHAIIVPIPLHPRKERVRGFNQAELIARHIANRMSLPMDTQALIRSTATAPQTYLRAQERRVNVENIFSPGNTEHIRGKTIIVLDDVKTTGATLEQAARILKHAGAKEIWAITFAH